MTLFLKRLRAFRAAAKLNGSSAFAHIRWLGEWARSQRKSASSMKDEQPWMTFGSIAFLNKELRPDMRVYEWGSGGSTLFYAHRVKEVIAIENDKAWAENVRSTCAERGITNVTIELIPQDPLPAEDSFDPADPAVFISNARFHRGAHFQQYATHIAQFPDAHFDLIVVDGRVRPSCIQQAIPKLKPGGLLVLDNAEREWYQRARALLDTWKRWEFAGPAPYLAQFSLTVAWRKPA